MAIAPTRSTLARTVKDGGEAAVSTARRTPGPVKAAGLAAAGLAGGLALGSHTTGRREPLAFLGRSRRTVLGLPIGRERPAVVAARAVAQLARASDDVHELRRQLEQANRQSPVEVLLSGLTHRRGANRAEH